MSRLAIHKGGSAFTVTLRHKTDGRAFVAIVIWPNMGSDIFIFSNEALLCGCVPADSDWLKYGYQYSYLLRHGNISTGIETFDLMLHLPESLQFVGFGLAVDSSRMGEAALKMDLNSLRKGQALLCEIMTSAGVVIAGRLFRNRHGFLYLLHNDPRAGGSAPAEEDWKARSHYNHSWQILENDLRNDCKPETYKHLGGALQLYDYDVADNAHDQRIKARSILKENVGARVKVQTSGGTQLDGVLIMQKDNYYILHNNPTANGDRPPKKVCVDGFPTSYSWGLDHTIEGSSQIIAHTFELVHPHPMRTTLVDPMNPIAKSVVGGVVDPMRMKDACASTYDPQSFEEKKPKNEEPELIMFKKPTAKVTRCAVQPMQSPQIITKKKK